VPLKALIVLVSVCLFSSLSYAQGCRDLTQIAEAFTFPADDIVYVRNFSAICDVSPCRNGAGSEYIYDYNQKKPKFVLGEYPNVSQVGCDEYHDGRGNSYTLQFVDDTTIYFDSPGFIFDLNIVALEANYGVVVFSYWTQVIGIPTFVHIIAGHGEASRPIVEQVYNHLSKKVYRP
jgi:hypothetical protein